MAQLNCYYGICPKFIPKMTRTSFKTYLVSTMKLKYVRLPKW